MIPKIFHHIWVGPAQMPERCHQCLEQMRNLHPDFEFKFWRDAELDAFMADVYPEYQEKLNALPRMIMRVDMLRYFLMHHYGGIYTDVDYLMLRPFDLLEHRAVIPCNREDSKGAPSSLGNCIFASEPGHPFWLELMQTLHTIDRQAIDHETDEVISDSPEATGPIFVYTMWQRSRAKADIVVPKRALFHPQTRHESGYREALQAQGIYGIHLCTGLWRGNRL